MSTMPGASVSPRASTRWRAAPRSPPTATMRPPVTATPPARAGLPSPSMTRAPSITRSCTRAPWPSAAVVRVGTLHLEDVVDARVEVAGQAADRPQAVHVEPPGGRVVEAVAHVQVHDPPEHEVGTADGHDAVEAAFHRDLRVRHAPRLHARGPRHPHPSHPQPLHLRRALAAGQVHLRGERVVHRLD